MNLDATAALGPTHAQTLGPPVLRLEGLHKSFGPLEVLRGIDLTVHDHEVVCLIGASGSGSRDRRCGSTSAAS